MKSVQERLVEYFALLKAKRYEEARNAAKEIPDSELIPAMEDVLAYAIDELRRRKRAREGGPNEQV